jgi:hypothetical protein
MQQMKIGHEKRKSTCETRLDGIFHGYARYWSLIEKAGHQIKQMRAKQKQQ